MEILKKIKKWMNRKNDSFLTISWSKDELLAWIKEKHPLDETLTKDELLNRVFNNIGENEELQKEIDIKIKAAFLNL